jgi:hypothetical protein
VNLTKRRRGSGEVGDERQVEPVRPGAQLAARAGLWSLVVIGCLGGIAGVLRPAPAAPVVASESSSTGASAGVAGFAELAVGAWLEATDSTGDRLAALFLDPPAVPGGSTTLEVRRVASVATRRVEDGYWAVTVAAEVVEADRDRAVVSAPTLYVEVGVVDGPGGALGAVGVPALVPAPASISTGVRVAAPSLGVPPPDDPVATTTQGFLTALLTGAGDVSRYLAPDVTLAAVAPAPFVEVTVERLGVEDLGDGSARVRVSAVATTAAGGRRTVGYELAVVERDGRWEIRSISGAPTLEPARGPMASSTSTSTPVPQSTSIASGPGA